MRFFFPFSALAWESRWIARFRQHAGARSGLALGAPARLPFSHSAARRSARSSLPQARSAKGGDGADTGETRLSSRSPGSARNAIDHRRQRLARWRAKRRPCRAPRVCGRLPGTDRRKRWMALRSKGAPRLHNDQDVCNLCSKQADNLRDFGGETERKEHAIVTAAGRPPPLQPHLPGWRALFC